MQLFEAKKKWRAMRSRGGPDIALDVWVAEQQEDSCGHTLDIQEEFLSGEFMWGAGWRGRRAAGGGSSFVNTVLSG